MCSTYVNCNSCGEKVEITQALAEFIGSDIQLLCDDLYNALKIMHRNCDPTDMTVDDAKIWDNWDKAFNPQNYNPEEL